MSRVSLTRLKPSRSSVTSTRAFRWRPQGADGSLGASRAIRRSEFAARQSQPRYLTVAPDVVKRSCEPMMPRIASEVKVITPISNHRFW
jgi:hypothetical protein